MDVLWSVLFCHCYNLEFFILNTSVNCVIKNYIYHLRILLLFRSPQKFIIVFKLRVYVFDWKLVSDIPYACFLVCLFNCTRKTGNENKYSYFKVNKKARLKLLRCAYQSYKNISGK
jgi:hypothetical protein